MATDLVKRANLAEIDEHRTKILEKVWQKGVFMITKTKDGYKLEEACDFYYNVTLTQKEFEQLIKELQSLATNSEAT